MSRNRGVTLVELLFALAILAIAVAIATPSLGELLNNHRASTATQDLRSALDFARESAVHSGQSTSIAPLDGDWNSGWEVYPDPDNRGQRQPQNAPLIAHGPLGIRRIQTDTLSRRYIHFTPRGNSIQPNGALHAGTLTLCGDGSRSFRIILNKVGRIRTESGTTDALCPR
ncbi:type IV fimbrial biogenesis protein FimT [Pseudomonas nitritireducens]|uniref:Type II secretion system protein H n=1 Tax=Pseudomonas nitroreducens TaxID=46680 RepID=A0A7W7KLT6_PSENT|nr:GspH/FimT family protein [Pseudomonas nitritireducens]MBB4865157.1 type IV fimbrial biogenesis protein FimT [Pseudomonas nitritireducens]